MGFLKRNNRLFYTILLDSDICKIQFRELNSKRAVIKDGLESIEIENAKVGIQNYMATNGNCKEKDYICVLQTSYQQGLSDTAVDGFSVQYIDKDVYSYANSGEIEAIKDNLGFYINEFISPFKVLYFLFKNQEFKGASLFVLKFSSSAAFMVADENVIYFAKMINLTERFIEIIQNDPSVAMDDSDELFYRVISGFVSEYYESYETFINSIFIYDIGSLGPETGYYIFTRIFIKTHIVPINLMDFINKINIKENF